MEFVVEIKFVQDRKKQKTQFTIQADNEADATEWGIRQAKHHGLSDVIIKTEAKGDKDVNK